MATTSSPVNPTSTSRPCRRGRLGSEQWPASAVSDESLWLVLLSPPPDAPPRLRLPRAFRPLPAAFKLPLTASPAVLLPRSLKELRRLLLLLPLWRKLVGGVMEGSAAGVPEEVLLDRKYCTNCSAVSR